MAFNNTYKLSITHEITHPRFNNISTAVNIRGIYQILAFTYSDTQRCESDVHRVESLLTCFVLAGYA